MHVHVRRFAVYLPDPEYEIVATVDNA